MFRIFITLLFFLNLLNANLLQETIDDVEEGDIMKLPKRTQKGKIKINKPISNNGKEAGVIID